MGSPQQKKSVFTLVTRGSRYPFTEGKAGKQFIAVTLERLRHWIPSAHYNSSPEVNF